jgi:hypothetical protein
MKKEFFVVSVVSREDLINQGWDAENIDDSTMQNFADKMGEAFCDCGYWDILNGVAEHYNLKKIK